MRVGPGGHAFDAVRIDFWGPDPHAYALRFEPAFLAWIRHLTGQDWVGVYEAHTDSRLKYGFDIDEEGRALPPITALLKGIRAQGVHVHPLNASLFQEAFYRSLREENPPLYWTLWQDASVYLAMNRTREIILTLVLSLEVARHVVFPHFARTKAEPGLGAVLMAPFDGTDLLKHLSSALEKVRNRNLQKEEPKIWQSIKSLYIARHHVAHGRPPVFSTLSGLQSVDDQNLVTWWNDVRSALLWIESL